MRSLLLLSLFATVGLVLQSIPSSAEGRYRHCSVYKYGSHYRAFRIHGNPTRPIVRAYHPAYFYGGRSLWAVPYARAERC